MTCNKYNSPPYYVYRWDNNWCTVHIQLAHGIIGSTVFAKKQSVSHDWKKNISEYYLRNSSLYLVCDTVKEHVWMTHHNNQPISARGLP